MRVMVQEGRLEYMQERYSLSPEMSRIAELNEFAPDVIPRKNRRRAASESNEVDSSPEIRNSKKCIEVRGEHLPLTEKESTPPIVI
jgi:hypothetical protein